MHFQRTTTLCLMSHSRVAPHWIWVDRQQSIPARPDHCAAGALVSHPLGSLGPMAQLHSPTLASTAPAVAHRAIAVGARSDSGGRAAREAAEERTLATGATRAEGAGNRSVPESPDPLPHVLRARPRSHPPQPAVQAPRRQVPGLHRPRGRPPTDPAHPRHRGAVRLRSASPRPVGLNVSLTAAAATGHDCGHGPAGHASEGALRRSSTGLPPRGLRRRRRPRTTQPLRRDARCHPQPLLEPAGSSHPRGRGRRLGRPHRVRVPRLRRRRRRRHRPP